MNILSKCQWNIPMGQTGHGKDIGGWQFYWVFFGDHEISIIATRIL
jgi:hypothetical protein